jgi:hypothetical protein
MKITLRKANAVQAAINETLKSLSFDAQVRINEFEDAEAKIATAQTKHRENVERKHNLLHALYSIRKSVSRSNCDEGINDMLADVARFEKDVQFFGGLAKETVRETSVVLVGKLDKIRNRKDEGRASLYGREDNVDTSIFTAEDINSFKKLAADAKKRKQKLQDTLLEANVRVEIELAPEVEETLKQEDLI